MNTLLVSLRCDSPRLGSQEEALNALVAEPLADFTKAEDFLLMDEHLT